MAYNKDNYEENRLTPKQEIFVDNILQGKTQYESYITAYPRAKKWTRNSVDVAANHMMENNKIILRLREMGWKDKTKVMWTRQKALETINYVMDMNRQDMERINEAYQTEVDILESKLEELARVMPTLANKHELIQCAREMQDITAQIARLKKQRRTNSTNARGIYEGAKILNRMFGYDITKVEINTEDTERNEMEKLSAEELRELINISKKGDN